MIYNKKFIIGFLVVVAIIGIAVTLLLTSHKEAKTPDTSVNTSSQNTSSAPLTIKNFSSYEDLSVTTKNTIIGAIDHYISDTPHHTAPVGVIREGSYKKTESGTITNIVFLVDIASLKRTYKINFGTDSSTGQQTLYTLCPSSDELIYPAFNCKDDLSED